MFVFLERDVYGNVFWVVRFWICIVVKGFILLGVFVFFGRRGFFVFFGFGFVEFWMLVFYVELVMVVELDVRNVVLVEVGFERWKFDDSFELFFVVVFDVDLFFILMGDFGGIIEFNVVNYD